MSEIITSEILTEEFTPLLFEMRSLLYGVRQNDVVNQFTVTEHTDTRTVMTVGNPRESILHFVMEDTMQGVLARSLKSHATPDGMVTEEDTILLSTPKNSRMLSAERHSMSKSMYRPAHDSNFVLDQIAAKSTSLTPDAVGQWYAEIHELIPLIPEHKPENRSLQPKSTAVLGRLFGRHVSRV